MAVNPLRPQTLPVPVPGPSPASAARTAAQKAFFQAALGGEQIAAARQAPPVEPVSPASRFTPQSMQRADAPAEAPTRILRPGSFIDIKV
jgi:hypothetical protein